MLRCIIIIMFVRPTSNNYCACTPAEGKLSHNTLNFMVEPLSGPGASVNVWEIMWLYGCILGTVHV